MSEADPYRLYQAGRFEEAEAAFADATRRQPGSAEAWSGLGHAAAARLEHGRAVEAFRRAIALGAGAEEAAIRLNLGRSLFALGQVGLAMAENERAARAADPDLRGKAIANAMIMAPGDPALGNDVILAFRRR